MVKFDSTVAKTGTTQIIRRGHIQFKFGSHNFNFLIPPEYFTTPSPLPELSLPLLKFLNPPKISHPPPPKKKKISTPPEKISTPAEKISPHPEKNRNSSRKNLNPEISQPPIYLINLLINGIMVHLENNHIKGALHIVSHT